MQRDGSSLERTLEAASRDEQTVATDGRALSKLPDGCLLRSSVPHVDDRGSLFEIFSAAWHLDDKPVEHVYAVTIRPGVAKGWALHKEHGDRYFIISGDLQVVLYDPRPGSSTCGQVITVTLSERNRQLLTIPTFVWHADYNCSEREAVLLNMPTKPYDHAHPDKYRLPLDTPHIPYDFGGVRGG